MALYELKADWYNGSFVVEKGTTIERPDTEEPGLTWFPLDEKAKKAVEKRNKTKSSAKEYLTKKVDHQNPITQHRGVREANPEYFDGEANPDQE